MARPVWSPRAIGGPLTKQNKGRSTSVDASWTGPEERLLTASFLDEGPSWAPKRKRVIMFARENPRG